MAKKNVITAAHGEKTGKPSMSQHVAKQTTAVNEAIQTDARFKTGKDSSGNPTGNWNKPYAVDILVPDDDGKQDAVIRTDDGRLVRHGFSYDAEKDEAKMDDGSSTETECTPVYAKAIEAADKEQVSAGGKAEKDKASSEAYKASADARGASAKANESGTAEDHTAAATAHDKAAKAHEDAKDERSKHGAGGPKAVDENMAAEHSEQAERHETKADDHREKAADCTEASATEITNDIIRCHASSSPVASDDGNPVSEFQWMPEGVTTIQAGYRGGAIELTVECDKDTAKTVKASFDRYVAATPRRAPFGCIEHREEEAAFHPKAFGWKDTPEPGVYCTAEWTTVGARNVRGKVHTSFSPSFTTDADYGKAECVNCSKKAAACRCGSDRCLSFPDGVRGSESNPARVTGVSRKSVGSLTNWPAFSNILPVRAKQVDNPQPANKENADTTKGKQVKVHMIRARGTHAAGTTVDLADKDAVEAIIAGDARTQADHDAITASNKRVDDQKAAQKEADKLNIIKAVSAAKARKAIAPKDEEIQAKALKRLDDGVPLDIIVETIEAHQSKGNEALYERTMESYRDDGSGHVVRGRETVQETCTGYLTLRKDMDTMIKAGGEKNIVEAVKISKKTSRMLRDAIMPIMAKGGDFNLQEIVRAADTVDTGVGTLETGLVLMRNLGFLKNMLGFLPYISTDLRNEPARFGQNILTRYITAPGVLTFIPGLGFTSDATTITNWKATITSTNPGGTLPANAVQTLSVASATDVSVVINSHMGTEISFGESVIGSTVRNLFAEQQGAQIYSLAEQVNKDFLSTVFKANWTGVSPAKYSLGANFNLPGVIGIKTKFALNKMPEMGRFVLLNSVFYDNVLRDSNLLNAKAIIALIKGDESAFNNGDLPPLFGLKLMESQLAASLAGTLTTITDPNNMAGVVDTVGFAGNSASAVFAARVPMDYTQIIPNIPSTATIEIVTEPDSGLSVMLVKRIDHNLQAVFASVRLMYGFSQGDPRQGFLLGL